MDSDLCAICGQPADDPHHLTGRGCDGAYLDPDLTASTCHDDHELLHEDLRNEGVDKPLAQATIVEKIVYRLTRTAVFVGRMAEAIPGMAWLANLARGLRRWAEDLRGFVAVLDAWNSGWRILPGS
jgi:hypothetical protein